jgi:hypothetical protein
LHCGGKCFYSTAWGKMARNMNTANLKRVFGGMLFFLAAFMFNESRKAFGL